MTAVEEQNWQEFAERFTGESALDPALFDGPRAGSLTVVIPRAASGLGSGVGSFAIGLRTFRADPRPLAERAEAVPLVLLHAFPVDGRMWATSMACLDGLLSRAGGNLADLPIYGLDVPGVPGVPLPSAEACAPALDDGGFGPQVFHGLADSFVAQLRQLGYRRAVWAGLSMGGYLALDIVERHPEAVAGFALCDSNPYADDPRHRANRLAMADRAAGADGPQAVMHFARPAEGDSALKKTPAYRQLFAGWIQSQPGEGLAWRERMAAGRTDTSTALEILADRAIPSLFVSGQRDPSSGPEVMRPLAEQVPGCLFEEIPDAGHFTAVERPAQFARALLPLIAAATL